MCMKNTNKLILNKTKKSKLLLSIMINNNFNFVWHREHMYFMNISKAEMDHLL